MLNLSKEKLLIITALLLAGVSLVASIVLGLQVIKLKQDLTRQTFPTPSPTVIPPTVTPFVTKKPMETPVLPTETAPISELEAKEKCEASGGKWGAECSSSGCGPGYCVCILPCSEEKFPRFDHFEDPNKDSPRGLVRGDLSKCGYRVESGGVCKDCQSDSDCGETRFSQGRAYCFEYRPKCISGVCYEERKIYSGYNIKSDACRDTCGDSVCDNFETVLCPEDCQ